MIMRLLSKLLFVFASGVIGARAQWCEPVRIAALSTAADEFAPAWSPADSTLYFARQYNGTVCLFACRWDAFQRAIAGESIQLDTIGDSIVYVAFNSSSWVGHRLVRGKRQHYAQLVYSPVPIRRAASAISLDELNQAEEFVMFPALSPDGRVLVFAVTDGQLTTDLFTSYRHGSQWGSAIPLEGIEQSDGSEITPCFIGNDTLMFASNGYGGKGGFDLFVTRRREGQWLPPEPLSVLNSSSDDRDPCLLPNGDLLFVSNRAGSFDLYYAPRIQKGRSP